MSYFRFIMAENLKLEELTSIQLLDRIETLEKAHVGEDVLAATVSTDDASSTVYKLSNKERVSCKHCGYPHQSVFCKFKHLNCRKCGIKGHLERVCLGKQNSLNHRNAKEFSSSRFKKGSVKVVAHESEADEDSVPLS